MQFVKEILTEGEYEVSTFEGSKKKAFTAEDLKKMASTGSKMLKAGIKIPAPFKHVQEGMFVTPVVSGLSSMPRRMSMVLPAFTGLSMLLGKKTIPIHQPTKYLEP